MKCQLTKEGRAYVGHVTPILLFYLLLYVLDIDHPSSDNAPWYTLTVLWTSAVIVRNGLLLCRGARKQQYKQRYASCHRQW